MTNSTTLPSTALINLNRMRRLLTCCAAVLLINVASAAELMVTEATRLSFDHYAGDGRSVVSLMERLWWLPAGGGTATPMTPVGLRLEKPRFSPDGKIIIAEGGWRTDRMHLWRINATGDEQPVRLMGGGWRDHSASWHPDGTRLLFVSNRSGTEDIWEYDLQGQSARRLTLQRGREYDAQYAGNGSIVYVREHNSRFEICVLGGDGRTRVLLSSANPLYAPVVRRNGILITYLERQDDGHNVLKMLLPVQEMLSKTLLDDGDIGNHPVVWTNRDNYLLVRNGRIERRELAGRGFGPLAFTAWLSVTPASQATTPDVTPAEIAPTPNTGNAGRGFVLRASRLFDTATLGYRLNHDILIEDGSIAAVVARRHWPKHQIIDMGDATLLPGLIDIDARANDFSDTQHARRVLAAGVTSVAYAQRNASGEPIAALPAPGPRVFALGPTVDARGVVDSRERIALLQNARAKGIPSITDTLLPDLMYGPQMLAGGSWPQASSASPVYSDLRGLLEKSGVRVMSGNAIASGWTAADWNRVGNSRWGSMNASAAGPVVTAAGGNRPALATSALSLPGALSLTGKLISMRRTGASANATLAGATVRAADILGRPDLGRLQVGALADIVVVAGDPLDDIGALLDTVAIVSRGQFHSVAGLLEDTTMR